MIGTLYVYQILGEKYTMLTSDHNDGKKTTRSTEEVLNLIDDQKIEADRNSYDQKYREFLRKNLF